ncbi:ankyrin repeat-containing protein [Botrytis cinerea]
MSSHLYSLLPENGNNIRLLRLLPSEDEAAPLYCELCNYSLQRSSIRTHLYEALSYFQVTVNLHAALLQLRDHSFERIIWVDAICIDQNNKEERKQQVQLMAKIYISAHRVIVWLGEQTIDTKGALEDIQGAANDEELIKHSKKELKQQNILNLLQNPWFQRIWVLQEVAAARNIAIMCGSVTIDGYVFCLGVKSLKLFYTASPELQTLPSVIYLIERAGFRPKLKTDLPERFSLKIRSLAELIDMFHTRQATDSRDKVYALLGMSSDDPENAGLQPDYETSWEEIFQQLVKFVLGKDISVRTSSQKVVIKCKGCILGQVSSVSRDDSQHVNIISRNRAWNLGSTMKWTLQSSAKPIQENDIICLFYGASKPTIIRLCKDRFAVVVIAATPITGRSFFEWSKLSQSTTQFLRGFLLVWDWGNSYGKLQDQAEYETLTKIYSQVLLSSEANTGGHLDEAIRVWNDISILDDLKEHSKADTRLLKARSDYMAALGKDYLPGPLSQYSRTLLSFAAGEGHEDITKLLLNAVHPDIKDGKYNWTPLLLTAANGHEAVVKILLATGQVEIDWKDKYNQTPLSLAARNGHEAVVKLLLATGQVEIDWKSEYNRTPLSLAAENGHAAVVKLLLATGQVEIDWKDKYDQTPLSLAARNGHEAAVKLLLATSQVEIDWKNKYNQTPLSLAAENGHVAVVKLLLASNQIEVNWKNKYNQIPLSLAARNGHTAIVKLLLATGQVEINWKSEYNLTPLSLAAENGHEAVVKLLLATDQVEVDWKSEYDQTPLLLAARNGHEAVVKLLLATGQVEIDWKNKYNRTPLLLAAENGHAVVVKLLLATGQVEIDWKNKYNRTPLLLAAENGHAAVVKLLLATGQVEIDWKNKYNRTPLLLAAANGHAAVVKLLLATGQVEINWKDKDNRTPLSLAARNGHEAVVKLLLANNQIGVNWKSEYNRTPLSWAARNGHEAVVKLLLATGQVEVDWKDKYNQTPLLLAARNGHEAVVKLLLTIGQVEVQTALLLAARNGHAAVVKLLLAISQIEVDWKSEYSRTALSLAAENGHAVVVKLLLATGQVEIDWKDKSNQTPLWLAARNGHEAVVKLLDDYIN